MNKTALITGSSRGIGAATGLRLASEGYDICINYVKNDMAARDVADKIRSQGRKVITVKADVSKEDDVKDLFEAIDNGLGELSVLVNNAGILLNQSRVENMTAERINKIWF